jgi:hypothetical protein
MVMLRLHIATEMMRQKRPACCGACYDDGYRISNATSRGARDALMDHRIPSLIVGAMHGAAAATAMMLVAAIASSASAQTLTDPNPPAKWSPPQAAAKPPAAASAKPCPGYGAGFVKLPGSDACIKIGGWVSVEGSAGR